MIIQGLTIDIHFGRMDTAEEEARVKRLYHQLEQIRRDWANIQPAPSFKITCDKLGQVHVKLNERLLSYLLIRFGTIDDVGIPDVTSDDPPTWFMALMGNEPYEHLLPPEGAVIGPR